MKIAVLIVFLCSITFKTQCKNFDPNEWVEIQKIFVAKKSPSQEQVIFLNTYTGKGLEPSVWHVIDISNQIPISAKAVNIMGIMLVTRGINEETANMTINFRNLGEEKEYVYQGQVIENLHSGQRSPISLWVPLTDGKFEFKWDRPHDGKYPEWASYCLNLWINAWGE